MEIYVSKMRLQCPSLYLLSSLLLFSFTLFPATKGFGNLVNVISSPPFSAAALGKDFILLHIGKNL